MLRTSAGTLSRSTGPAPEASWAAEDRPGPPELHSVWSHMVKIISPWSFPDGKTFRTRQDSWLVGSWSCKVMSVLHDCWLLLRLCCHGWVWALLPLDPSLYWTEQCRAAAVAEQETRHQCGGLSSPPSFISLLEFPILLSSPPKSSQLHIWFHRLFICAGYCMRI